MEEILKEQSNKILNDINTIINQAIVEKQTNEQWFIDFLDELNKYSISF